MLSAILFLFLLLSPPPISTYVQRLMKSSSIAKFYLSSKSGLERDIRSAIVSRSWNTVENLLERLQTTILPSGRNAVFVVSETCRRSNNMTAVIPLLSLIPKSSLQCKEDDIMPMLSDCVSTGDMISAQKIFSWLEENGIPLTAKIYSLMLKGYGRRQNIRMVDKLLINFSLKNISVDLVMFNTVLDAYIRCGKPQKAARLFQLLSPIKFEKCIPSVDIVNIHASVVSLFAASNLQFNVRTYNTYLKALRELGPETYQLSLDVVLEMEKIGVSADSITVNTLINACVLVGDLEGAERMLSSTSASAIPGVEAYTSLLVGYTEKRDVDGAFSVLELMKTRGIAPNGYTLTALMTACLASGAEGRAKELLRRNNEIFFSKDASISSTLRNEDLAALYGAYIIGVTKMYPKNNRWATKEIDSILKDMDYLRLLPDITTVNAYLQYLFGGEESRGAAGTSNVFKALKFAQATMANGVSLDDYSYSILFTALGKEGYVEEALALYRSSPIQLDAPAVNSLLRAFVSGPNPLHAIDLFNELTSHNTDESSEYSDVPVFIPTKITFTILFAALTRILALDKYSSVLSDGHPREFFMRGNDGFATHPYLACTDSNPNDILRSGTHSDNDSDIDSVRGNNNLEVALKTEFPSERREKTLGSESVSGFVQKSEFKQRNYDRILCKLFSR